MIKYVNMFYNYGIFLYLLLQVALPTSEDTLYWCKIFKLPNFKRKHHMVRVSFYLYTPVRFISRFSALCGLYKSCQIYYYFTFANLMDFCPLHPSTNILALYRLWCEHCGTDIRGSPVK